MKIIKGKIFIRAWPANAIETVGKAALVGIVEISGPVISEKIHSVVLTTSGENILLTATGSVRKHDDDVATYEVDSIMTCSDWERPAEDTGLDGGGLFLRETRAPGTEAQTFLIMGVMSTNELEDQTMLDIAGDINGVMTISNKVCAKHLNTNGSSLNQVMKRPIWGWGEPWGLTTTMRVKVLEDMHRLNALWDGAEENFEGETTRLERGHAGDVLNSGKKDKEFQRFRSEWIKRYGPMPLEYFTTASQQESFSQRASTIIREVIKAA